MDYKNGKIYAIRNHQTEQIYIGSTTQTLTKRLSHHKNNKGCSSCKIIQYRDAYIELIELFPCNSKEELNKKEGEHIRINNCVNKNIAGRTPKEYKAQYYEENKEKSREKHKQYYENNKEKIREQQKQYYENNKEKS
jgi:hypothetical protein